MATDKIFDGAGGWVGGAVSQSEIRFGDTTCFKLLDQAGDGALGFSNDHDAGGLFIEAVDDAGAGGFADIPEVVAMVEQGINQRAFFMAWGGVDYDTGGFIDHKDVVILKEEVEWDILRGGGGGFGWRDGDGNLHAGCEAGAGFEGDAW